MKSLFSETGGPYLDHLLVRASDMADRRRVDYLQSEPEDVSCRK